MKKFISTLMLCIFLGMQFTAFAAPCALRFASGYAFAVQALVQSEIACNEATWTAACLEEIHRGFRNTVHNLQQDFSGCCCESGYTQCCN